MRGRFCPAKPSRPPFFCEAGRAGGGSARHLANCCRPAAKPSNFLTAAAAPAKKMAAAGDFFLIRAQRHDPPEQKPGRPEKTGGGRRRQVVIPAPKDTGGPSVQHLTGRRLPRSTATRLDAPSRGRFICRGGRRGAGAWRPTPEKNIPKLCPRRKKRAGIQQKSGFWPLFEPRPGAAAKHRTGRLA